ncbi:hypothetical protein [Litorilituus lipolyticus]|uniref:DUF2846 domain-containing protein n=1 Tax=Litorilituus lipolyticus TaxID=2491017 RepID=A0A502L5H0_9GAMM|nr:hypothetical protein [Litorilituus lipolyticus]TPH19158.1 hypothetical protein EPA86_00040 [Litorilituus lipolyticus]
MKNTLLRKCLTGLSLIGLVVATSANAGNKVDGDEQVNAKGECGVITLYNKPPATKDIHFASINSIDGVTTSMESGSFTLTPGKHIIRVIEHVRENSITRRRGEAKNYHIIEFQVEANKKYALGAKYNRKNRNKFKTGEYWTPVVWKTTDVECKL